MISEPHDVPENAEALVSTVLSFSEKYLASPENRPQEPVKSVDIMTILAALTNEQLSPEQQAELDKFIDSYTPTN